MKVIYDENGNPVDELAERNEEIKAKLDDILQEFIAEKETNRALKVKEKLGYRFAKQIFLVLNEYPRMTPEKFSELDYEDIEDFWAKYLALTAYYNRYFEIVDNRQLLCAFMGINSRQYAELENSDDEDIKNLMCSINSTFIGLGFVAGESGNADVKATSQRMRTKGEGHNLISASEDKLLEKVEAKSPLELERQLASIMGGVAKLSSGK
ncbi:MAG: hypothetical protein IKB02_05755 [Clostridia bacterium]|nr:hypothetical protein [Clostridia bacterium]